MDPVDILLVLTFFVGGKHFSSKQLVEFCYRPTFAGESVSMKTQKEEGVAIQKARVLFDDLMHRLPRLDEHL
ncbi:hypothetical protein Gpo141_00003975 [Globisporangium polare]